MSLFWMEFQKILSRKPHWICLGVLAVLCSFMWGTTLAETDTVIDGVRYHGLEAIRRDRELAREWEGELTEQKLYQIIDTYGLAVNESADKYAPRLGNWLSRYATDELTDYRQKGEEDDHSQVNFREESGLVRRLNNENGNSRFGYMDNLDYFWEMTLMVNILLLLIIVLALAPVLSEEYQFQTAPLIRTCTRGHEKLLRAKLSAALVFAEGLYILVNAALGLFYIAVYGTDGFLNGSLLFSQWMGYGNLCIGQVFFINFVWGMLGVCLMVVLALFFSSRCTKSFAALAGGLACLAAGPVLVQVFAMIAPFGLLRLLCRIAGMFSPYYLMMVTEAGNIQLWAWLRLPWVEAVTAACLVGIKREWERNGY